MKRWAGAALILGGLVLAYLALTSSTMAGSQYGVAIIVAVVGLAGAALGASWVWADRGGR
jgi:hypothetical protein